MVAIKNILFFLTAVSALTINRRDAAAIQSDITKIDSQVKALTSALNNYNGGFFGAIAISNAEGDLEKAIDQGTSDAQATSPLDSATSTAIINQIKSPLSGDIQSSLQALVAKKSQLASAGLTSTVQKDLDTLKAKTDAFGNALIAIASADTVNTAQSTLATIDGYFATAISAYAS